MKAAQHLIILAPLLLVVGCLDSGLALEKTYACFSDADCLDGFRCVTCSLNLWVR